MLGAGAAAIGGGREKAVMASGRCVGVIVAVPHGRVCLVIVMIVAARRRVSVAMLLYILIVMIFGMVLRTDCQRDHCGQRKRRHRENYRLPGSMTHGHSPLGW